MDKGQNIKELKLELERLGAIDIQEELISEKMDVGKSGFSIRVSRQFVNDELEMVHAEFLIDHIPNERYCLMEYEMSRLKQINIDSSILKKHGFADLEDRIREIDWENLNPTALGILDVVSLETITEIKIDLSYLRSIDDEAAELAEQLEAKYLLNTPLDILIFDIDDLALKYLQRIIVVQGVDDEISMEQANNLFNGNAVFIPGIEELLDSKREKDHWIEMDKGGKMQTIYPEPEFNLRDKIAEMPIKEILGDVPIDEIAKILEKGGVYEATYIEGFTDEKVKLVAEPSYSWIGFDFVNSVIDDVREVFDLEASRISVNTENPFMSPQDIELLEEKITDHGFPNKIIPALHEKIRDGERGFQITSYGKKEGTDYAAELRFHTNDQGKVLFQSYQLVALRPNEWKQSFVQEFPVDQGLKFHLNEALNLMQKKSVLFKMQGQYGDDTQFWMKMRLDRKLSDGNYPIMPILEQRLNVNEALENFHLPNLEYDNIRQEVVRRLERGDTLNVTVLRATDTVKVAMEANPHKIDFLFKAKDGSVVESRELIDPKWIQSQQSNSRKYGGESNDNEENLNRGRSK
jgi:hypothetical protein